MVNLLKRNSLGIVAVIAGLLLILAFGFSTRTHAEPSTVTTQTSASATTTVAYLTAGTLTSIYQIDSGGTFSQSKVLTMQPIDAVAVFIQFTASTSASALTITPQWSNNGTDWYALNLSTLSVPLSGGVLSLASTTTSYVWTPGSATASTSAMVINLPSVAANHERVIYGTSTGNGAVYEEYTLKQNPQTN